VGGSGVDRLGRALFDACVDLNPHQIEAALFAGHLNVRYLTLQQNGNCLLLVLDEAHMYRGAKGAEVAFLLRRLRARLGIDDKPHKLRVIATSASLGSDAAAQENVRKFVADLTGKTPEDFVAIIGKREIPLPVGPATAEETVLLEGIDLDGISQAQTGEELRNCLSPVSDFYGINVESCDESEVLLALCETLNNKPYVNLLIREAAETARSISALSEAIFPETGGKQRALEALLTLGTLARTKKDAPGLVPTRVHGIFRGLHGLYACINNCCPGRQAAPGEKAALGKMFYSPQGACDACGSRVFEMASCRSCGSPYRIPSWLRRVGHLGQSDLFVGRNRGKFIQG